jgi:uncharacterized membrane protein (UPF0127 family)
MSRSIIRILAALLFVASAHALAAGAAYVELHGKRFSIEIAETEAEHEHGLMERTHMAADHGMLFVFQDDQPRAFWMKNTRIPLDMLFFDADKHLVSVKHDAPPCTTDPCPVYSSGAPARYVLELNAGQASKLGLTTGDVIQIHR